MDEFKKMNDVDWERLEKTLENVVEGFRETSISDTSNNQSDIIISSYGDGVRIIINSTFIYFPKNYKIIIK